MSDAPAAPAAPAADAAPGDSYQPPAAAARDSKAKAETGSTLGAHPETYPYLLRHIGETESELALRATAQGLSHAVMIGAPDEAYFLRWLIETSGFKRAIEIGVFRGTTTLQLARAVGEGGLVQAFDVTGRFLEEAKSREAWAAAGVGERIRFVAAPAAESLKALVDAGESGTYDIVFIDADKSSYIEYYELSLQLLRLGGVIAVDNVLWSGKVVAPVEEGDKDTATIIAVNEKIRTDPRVSAVMLGIADGLYLARKVAA